MNVTVESGGREDSRDELTEVVFAEQTGDDVRVETTGGIVLRMPDAEIVAVDGREVERRVATAPGGVAR